MKLLSIAFILSFFTITSRAQTATLVTPDHLNWQKMAETVVPFDQEAVDKVEIGEILIAGSEKFATIHFRVAEAQIDIKSLEVFYENGDKQDIAVNEIVKAGANSRVLDLNGEARLMKRIVFKYKAVAHTDDKKVRMELWGSQFRESIRK